MNEKVCIECGKPFVKKGVRCGPCTALYYRLRGFGLTKEQYDALLAAQGGHCATCDRTSSGPGRRLAVDHDHKTGLVRGLLCNVCNRTLGMIERETGTIRPLLAYLDNPPAVGTIGEVYGSKGRSNTKRYRAQTRRRLR